MSNFIPNLDKIRNGANFLGDIVRKAFEAIQAKFPIQAEDIASFFMSRANWNGAGPIPLENIPLQEIIDATTTGGASALNCIDILRDLVVQYKDDDALFFGPGHVLHRGVFKKQTCNDDGTWVSAVAASLTIPSECPTSPGTTTELEANTWYYVYAKLDVAGENPEYRISKTPPVRCDGAGPEHPTYPKMRFLGSFRTLDDGIIKPFHRYHNGRVFWREIMVGPYEPTYDFADADNGTFITTSLLAYAPPTADAIFLTAASNNKTGVRTTGDLQDPAGYLMNGQDDNDSQAWFEIPTNAMDSNTGLPTSSANVDWYISGNHENYNLSVAGYHEALL